MLRYKGSKCHSQLQYKYKGSQCHCTREASSTVLVQGKPVPQLVGVLSPVNHSGYQCHSITTKEARATVQLHSETVQHYNYKGSQCQYKSVPPYNHSESQCHGTSTIEASATIQLQGKPLPQYN